MSIKTEVSKEDAIVKVSKCKVCNGVVQVSVKHMMNKRSQNDFAKTAFQYNLDIMEMPLLEYNSSVKKWCNCD